MDVDFSGRQAEVDKPWHENVVDSIGEVYDYAKGAKDSLVNTAIFGLADKAAGLGNVAANYLFGKDDVDLKQKYYEPKRRWQAWEAKNPISSVGFGIARTF